MSAATGENTEEVTGTQPVAPAVPSTVEPVAPTSPKPMSPRNGPIEPEGTPLAATAAE